MKKIRPDTTPRRPLARAYWWSLAALAGAIVVLVWMLPDGRLLVSPDSDTVTQFVSWRAFAADSLRRGDFPLWNPYTYAGEPFLGGFQSALLYPPNLIFAVLPIARAINLCFLLHWLWLGVGVERLARQRGLHPIAAALAGFVLPASGAALPHMYAGHLSNVCTMAWTPWVFLGLVGWWRDARLRALLVAAASVAMQVLSGHVQYVFFTAVAVALYTVVHTIAGTVTWRRALTAVVVIYAGAAALSAAQILPGWAAAGEGLRQDGLDFSYLRMLSLPPANLVTLIAPGFFGSFSLDAGQQPYWGRWYPWEMNLFVGACGMLLAIVAIRDRQSRRAVMLDLLMSVALIALAFGANTPLFQWLVDWVPGFRSFRGLSKFAFPSMLFFTLLIAAGADALARGRVIGRAVTMPVLVAGAGLIAAGWWLRLHPDLVGGIAQAIRESRETYLPDRVFNDATFIRVAADGAGQSLMIAGLTLMVAAAGVLLARRWSALRWVPVVLLPIELAVFAATHIGTSSVSDAMPDDYRAFVASHPGDYRVLNFARPNNGFLLGKPDIWGNDPAVLKRYAEFMTSAQGGDPEHATQTLQFTGPSPLDAMLRLQYALGPTDRGMHAEPNPLGPPLPHVLLVSEYRVMSDRRSILGELNRSGFDPRRVVLLERAPEPRPESTAAAGTARVIAETSDTLEIEADAAAPAILVITDSYSRDWRARPLSQSAQSSYDVLPANYVLRAVPLVAGHHHLSVEYAPRSFTLGVVISIAAWLVWVGAWISRPD